MTESWNKKGKVGSNLSSEETQVQNLCIACDGTHSQSLTCLGSVYLWIILHYLKVLQFRFQACQYSNCLRIVAFIQTHLWVTAAC